MYFRQVIIECQQCKEKMRVPGREIKKLGRELMCKHCGHDGVGHSEETFRVIKIECDCVICAGGPVNYKYCCSRE